MKRQGDHTEEQSAKRIDHKPAPFTLYKSIFRHESTFDDVCMQVSHAIRQVLGTADGQFLEVNYPKFGLFKG